LYKDIIIVTLSICSRVKGYLTSSQATLGKALHI